MSSTYYTPDEQVVIDQAEAVKKQANARYAERAAATQRRLDAQDTFTADELCFAATARCGCGAGMAYPEDTGIHGAWYCSACLLEPKKQAGEHARFPFAFYEIKSEDQPSARGATTRPSKAA